MLDIFQTVRPCLMMVIIFIVPISIFFYCAFMMWKYVRATCQFGLRIAWYSTVLLVLSACALTVGHVSSLPDKAAEKQKHIVPGRSARSDIRQILGQPTAYNDRYRIEIYRDIDKEWTVPIFPPMPVQFWDRVIGYILITYNEKWVVDDFDTGVWKDFSSAPWGKEAQFVQLGAGGFALYTANPYLAGLASTGPLEALVGPVDWNQAVLSQPISSTQCIVYLLPDLLVDQIYVDEVLLADITAVDLSKAYFRLPLMPGEHRLKVNLHDLRLTYRDQSLEQNFTCSGGNPLYIDVSVDLEPKTSSWQGTRYKVHVEKSGSMPPDFNQKRLILYHNGRWSDIPDLTTQ
jgi:hypothetical protein